MISKLFGNCVIFISIAVVAPSLTKLLSVSYGEMVGMSLGDPVDSSPIRDTG